MRQPFWHLLTLAACLLTPAACSNKSSSSTGADSSSSTGGGASTSTAGQKPVASPAIPVLPATCNTTVTPDATVTVTTKAGFVGGTPQAVTRNLYSMNIDDKQPGDWNNTLNPAFVAYLQALKPALLRWPAGYYGQTYQFSPDGSQVNGFDALTPGFIDNFMALCNAVGAAPLMAVNIAGTTANALQFLAYVNQTKKYGVTWWQLGNEPDVNGWTTTYNPSQYAASYLSFAQAMSAADSTLKFAGVEIMTGADIIGLNPTNNANPDWATPILQGITARPPDAIAWHYYPLNSSSTNPDSSADLSVTHVLQEDASDWAPSGLDFAPTVMSRLRSLQASYAPQSEVWIDEFAEDSGQAAGQGVSDRVAGALWAADALGRYAEQGVAGMFKFIFKGGPEHFYTMLDSNNVPRPEYYTYWLYAQHWGDHVVASTTDQIASVVGHASTRAADGTLRVMLVNKAAKAMNVRLTLADFKPSAAGQYRMVGQAIDGSSVTVNGASLTATSVGAGESAIAIVGTANACADNVINVPALSATMLLFAP